MHYAILFAATIPVGIVAFAVSKLYAAIPPKPTYLRSSVFFFGGIAIVMLMAEVARLYGEPPPNPPMFLPSAGEQYPPNLLVEFATMSASVLLTVALLHLVAVIRSDKDGLGQSA